MRNDKIALLIKFNIIQSLFVFLHVNILRKNSSSRDANIIRRQFVQNLKFNNAHIFSL